jgi:ABC-type phosphate transport system substrate-binding protein
MRIARNHLATLACLTLMACSSKPADAPAAEPTTEPAPGAAEPAAKPEAKAAVIAIDGSSTVFRSTKPSRRSSKSRTRRA